MSSDSKNNPPFHVGQEVVALVTIHHHFSGGIKKGNIYQVLSIDRCRCGKWSVGFASVNCNLNLKRNCSECKSNMPVGNYWYTNAKHFAPVSRLRISEHLTIAEGLAVDAVEERADVKEIVNA